ncbi:hypothetical protein ABE29_20565 [Cytobacillus firmus]|uniref:DUF2332 domain-containing protein n=2 Tax=Cytobacillus firmus TaxID=1399 RepID=UPI00077CD683|nr:DUF2332 domain-containing protein [Cytobacillus firmus]MBG9545066.1 hypothetical protein [Cytobacillus firmus]MBG9554763.1 hypothetical protein [Cytobacillus firmus]MBG9559050.1 hypothetical protein [Cytobacillus firmus]MBG9574822.1 hypothetical protein [Cytobacillus firmus]MEC1895526.1 DUF2332 domain-containing protein [Cytobacillus firmus]
MFNTEVLSKTFLTFAERECKGSSLLYEYLSKKIASNETLLEICSSARAGQPVPNLLFGAVHYLLLNGKEHPLKEYYPSIVNNPKLFNESFEDFKDFCLKYRNEIESILKTKLVQTNEVRRCAYLYPAFCTIYEKAKKPLALIEIGTSAGLQLLWDKYSYSYGQKNIYGNKDSKLNISAEIKGENIPILHSTPPPVSTRVGIDLNIVDLKNEEEHLWLKSLIWPEHKERLFMFEEAASYVKDGSVHLVDGDGISLLLEYVENIPEDSAICIFHTHVANQISLEMKKRLLKTVETIGKERDVFHIYNNVQDRFLHLDYYLNHIESQNTIAATDGHGRWFEWFLKNELPITQ